MFIDWVNNASFILESAGVRLICDPWLDGTIFNSGWKLLSETKLRYEDFGDITHIWLSHEHPDHFSPPNLRSIPEQYRRKITVLFHETKDKRVVNVCRALGFQVQELVEGEPVDLAKDFRLVSGRQGLIDSWMAVFSEGKTVLNMNDCVYDRRRDMEAIKSKLGRVDLLLSQFSFANWVGNPGDHACHKEHAKRKFAEVRTQVQIFKPAMFVPFASFIYFCHAENFFMNQAVNHIRDVYRFVSQELHVPTVVLYPGDHWEVGAAHDSDEAMRRYDLDYGRMMTTAPETTASVTMSKLQEAAQAFLLKSATRNERYLLNALISSVVQIRDLGILVEFSYHHGLTEVAGKHPDIIMSSDSLLHCLSYDWGGECLAINGRYEVPAGGHPQLFFWIFRVPAHNRLGSAFDLAFLARQAVMRTVRAIAPQG